MRTTLPIAVGEPQTARHGWAVVTTAQSLGAPSLNAAEVNALLHVLECQVCSDELDSLLGAIRPQLADDGACTVVRSYLPALAAGTVPNGRLARGLHAHRLSCPACYEAYDSTVAARLDAMLPPPLAALALLAQRLYQSALFGAAEDAETLRAWTMSEAAPGDVIARALTANEPAVVRAAERARDAGGSFAEAADASSIALLRLDPLRDRVRDWLDIALPPAPPIRHPDLSLESFQGEQASPMLRTRATSPLLAPRNGGTFVLRTREPGIELTQLDRDPWRNGRLLLPFAGSTPFAEGRPTATSRSLSRGEAIRGWAATGPVEVELWANAVGGGSRLVASGYRATLPAMQAAADADDAMEWQLRFAVRGPSVDDDPGGTDG